MGGVTPWGAMGTPPRVYLRSWHISLRASPIGPRLVHAVARNRLHAWRKTGRFSEEKTEIYMAPLRRPLGTVATLARDRQLVRRDMPWCFRHAPRRRLRAPALHPKRHLDHPT